MFRDNSTSNTYRRAYETIADSRNCFGILTACIQKRQEFAILQCLPPPLTTQLLGNISKSTSPNPTFKFCFSIINSGCVIHSFAADRIFRELDHKHKLLPTIPANSKPDQILPLGLIYPISTHSRAVFWP